MDPGALCHPHRLVKFEPVEERKEGRKIKRAEMTTEESEAVFDAYNLKPQLFLNEVLNVQEDLLDEAFDYCLQQAPSVLGWSADSEKPEELAKAISALRSTTQAVMEKQMSAWEIYCLRHCFAVPEGLSSHTAATLGKSSFSQDLLSHPDLDNQIKSLRNKLDAVGRESAKLLDEAQTLERQDALIRKVNATIAEVLQHYERNSALELFKEIRRTSSALRHKLPEFAAKVDAGNSLPLHQEPMDGTLANSDIPPLLKAFLQDHQLITKD